MKKAIFLAVLGVLFSNCEKKDYFNVSSEDKALYDYQVGSYWNYVNTETNEMEKISVSKRDVSTFLSGHIDSNDEYGEEIATQLSSSLKNIKYVQTISYGYRIHSVTYNKYVNNILKSNDFILYDNLYDNDSAFSINIQGKEYDDVRLIQSFYNKYNDSITDPIKKSYVNQFWIARNRGIIKKTIQDASGITSYELKDCKIIQ